MFFCAVIGFGKLRAVRGEGAVGVGGGGGNKTGRVIICYWKFYFVNILHFEPTAVCVGLMLR